jgi:mRNA-degrading endonuclease toxin of MazEF toxin-antitoxin module
MRYWHDVLRGKIVYLFPKGHARIAPSDANKLGKRPFLVVQRDLTNSESDRTMVVGISTEPQKKVAALAKSKFAGVDAFLPRGKEEGLLNEDSFADCGNVFTVYESEIFNVFKDVYPPEVMQYVDHCLRFAMELDQDGVYRSQLP